MLTHDVVADPYSRPIEIAMIAKLRTRFSRKHPVSLSITHISGHAKFKTDLDIC